MENCESPVFGKMKYIYGWVKPSEVTVGDTKYNVLVEAVAKMYQDITPEQEKSYTDYLKHEDIYLKELESALQTPSIADGKFKPIAVRFDREGGFGFMLESTLDFSLKCFYRVKPNAGFEDIHFI